MTDSRKAAEALVRECPGSPPGTPLVALDPVVLIARIEKALDEAKVLEWSTLVPKLLDDRDAANARAARAEAALREAMGVLYPPEVVGGAVDRAYAIMRDALHLSSLSPPSEPFQTQLDQDEEFAEERDAGRGWTLTEAT